MKTSIKLFICMLFFNSNSFAKAQKDDSSIKMLKQFYTAYNTAWSSSKGTALLKKVDSLQKKYCTTKLRSIQSKADGHDLIINDQYTDVKHLKTLSVIKNPAKANGYIVSYIAPTRSAANEPIEVKVIIHVTVVKEEGVLKIASTDMSL